MKARVLTTVSDSTSQKFILIGQLDKREQQNDGRFAVVFLDFANTRPRQCGDSDFEDWYARTAKGKECLMGHKVRVLRVECFWYAPAILNMSCHQQWYKRRKQDANCYVGHKFEDPHEHEQNCPCEDDDYEWYGPLIERYSRDSPSGFIATTTTFEAATSVFQPVPNQSHRMFV